MRQIVWGLLAAGLVAAPAVAEEPRPATSLSRQVSMAATRLAAGVTARTPVAVAVQTADPEPAVTVTGGLDFPSLYLFRGIRQEADPKLTVQPFVNLAFGASETATVNVGTWNSFHTGSTSDAYGSFYESDFYVSGAFATGSVTSTLLYTAYTSPDDAFSTVHELAFIAGFDDSESSVPMAPAVTVAFELGDAGADGGVNKGVYLELAATPAIPMGDDAPVSLSVPIKLGMSLKDYYEHPVTGEDSKFGYFSIGLMALVPLSSNVDIHGGVLVYSFGDTLKFFNDDERAQAVGTVGLGFSF